MARVADQLEEIEKKVMSGLKDFQRATVERIDTVFRAGRKRVLVSDEVGLGKTLVARGVVAKVARRQKELDDNLVKVIYICSNAAIAGQNLNKLRISGELRAENTSSSRLSMQHLAIFRQESDPDLLDRYIQLIPLTPETSFRTTGTAGTVQERALMYALLRRMPALRNQRRALEVAMQDWAAASWNSWCRDFYEQQVTECDRVSHGEYLRYMTEKLHTELNEPDREGVTCLDELLRLCDAIRKNGFERVSNNKVIGRLRLIFARISLEKLEPDLVIMDEFQRFKFLLNSDPNSETGMLTRKFFHANNVRMLLLSATPYKMYSTMEEIDESQIDEHYSEFLDVMNFLHEDAQDKDNFTAVWNNYSVMLKELTYGDTVILEAKRAAEDAMYRTVCRTERVSAAEAEDLVEVVKQEVCVSEADIRSYVQAQELLDETQANYHVPVDYVKSCPYLLSFMKDYQLKRNIEAYFKKHPQEIRKLKKDTFWLDRHAMDRYDRIPCNNARLSDLMERTVSGGAERLLWVPPSKPYYALQGPFKNAGAFSKTLVFSSWEMVPRMIASLVSYEAERKTVGALIRERGDRNIHYFYSGEKRYPPARLNFSVRNGAPGGMTLFCLIYPSRFLTECFDPVPFLNRKASYREICRSVKEAIGRKLSKFAPRARGPADRRWYYMAPLLLDGPGYVTTWLQSAEELANYDDDTQGSRAKGRTGFLTHLRELSDLYQEMGFGRNCTLGPKPDDLLDVLTDMALAAPAICVNRSYRTYCGSAGGFPSHLPSKVARVFLNRMNTPEATAVVELVCGRKPDDAHWKNLLAYCRQGCFQAVMDEYCHLLSNGLEQDGGMVDPIHEQLIAALDIRTTQYTVDTLSAFRQRIAGGKEKPKRQTNLRTHFAVAFTKGDGAEKDIDRKTTVRSAFNSPFRPFVLATTSIGQEGLDFHTYCRRVVHWNLPSNPIDLEQREGRINRFECLAIRQNIAARYGDIPFKRDVWSDMFEEACRRERTETSSDLIPFWGLRKTDDMIRIERVVPVYPFSRDELSYERLIKILSLYRLTLGQARQEELLEYLFTQFEDSSRLKDLFINLSPYFKQKEKIEG